MLTPLGPMDKIAEADKKVGSDKIKSFKTVITDISTDLIKNYKQYNESTVDAIQNRVISISNRENEWNKGIYGLFRYIFANKSYNETENLVKLLNHFGSNFKTAYEELKKKAELNRVQENPPLTSPRMKQRQRVKELIRHFNKLSGKAKLKLINAISVINIKKPSQPQVVEEKKSTEEIKAPVVEKEEIKKEPEAKVVDVAAQVEKVVLKEEAPLEEGAEMKRTPSRAPPRMGSIVQKRVEKKFANEPEEPFRLQGLAIIKKLDKEVLEQQILQLEDFTTKLEESINPIGKAIEEAKKLEDEIKDLTIAGREINARFESNKQKFDLLDNAIKNNEDIYIFKFQVKKGTKEKPGETKNFPFLSQKVWEEKNKKLKALGAKPLEEKFLMKNEFEVLSQKKDRLEIEKREHEANINEKILELNKIKATKNNELSFEDFLKEYPLKAKKLENYKRELANMRKAAGAEEQVPQMVEKPTVAVTQKNPIIEAYPDDEILAEIAELRESQDAQILMRGDFDERLSI